MEYVICSNIVIVLTVYGIVICANGNLVIVFLLYLPRQAAACRAGPPANP